MNYENFVVLSPQQIAEAIDIRRQQVNRAINVLLKSGYLVKSEIVNNTQSYRLSLDYTWKGTAKAYNENVKLAETLSPSDLAKLRWSHNER